MKRSLSFILSLVMVISIITSVPVTVSAASEDDLIFTLDGECYYVSGCSAKASGEVIIPGEYNGLPVTGIGEDAFYKCTRLTTITISDKVTNIGTSAFAFCNNLSAINVDVNNDDYSSAEGVLFDKNKSILIKYPIGKKDATYTIPDSVTCIEFNAFNGCTNLENVTIPETVKNIEGYAFYGCTSLLSVFVPESVTVIGQEAFGFYDNSETQTWAKINGFKIYCFNGSAAQAYAMSFGLDYEVICAHRDFYWYCNKDATYTESGLKHKVCTECGEVLETATIPQLKCAKPVLKKVYNANSYVKVTWGTVKGADKYYVYRKTGTGDYEYIGSTTNKYFNDREAGAGKTCRYRIRAKNEAGCSEYSVSMAIKHIDEPNLITIENTSAGVKITWGKVTGAQKYNVYRRVSGGEYKYIGSTSDTYYIDETVKSGKKYHYAIRGKRDDSVSSQSESLSKYYLDAPILNKPSSTTKGIGIKWSQVEGAEGYVVYRRTTDDNYIIVANEKGGSNTDFRDTTTKKGRIYYYRVKAYKSKTYSGNSVTKSVRDEH